jgi:hypothetical protein
MAAIAEPMLARPGRLPPGGGWGFELKLDGFRALVDTHDGLRVLSRRGWNMTERAHELRALPGRHPVFVLCDEFALASRSSMTAKASLSPRLLALPGRGRGDPSKASFSVR